MDMDMDMDTDIFDYSLVSPYRRLWYTPKTCWYRSVYNENPNARKLFRSQHTSFSYNISM